MRKLLCIILSFIMIFTFLVGCSPKNKGFSKDDLIYFILTDRFNDGDESNNYDVDKKDPRKRHGGDLRGIIDKLDYIEDLGATAIWLTPVMENGKDGYHGYWIHDFYEIEPHLGTMDDMKELVKEAHKKDIKVILDYVVNHTGYDSSWLEDDDYKNWFNEEKKIHNWNNQEEVENGWLSGLPDLDHNNPEVNEYFIENALWWIKETGIDGMRLDTVKHVPRTFWEKFVSEIKKEYPDFYFLGEVWTENVRAFKSYSETGIDGMTNYPLYKGIITTFYEYGSTKNIKDAIKGDKNFQRPDLNGVFIDNHDNVRFMSKHNKNAEEYFKQALTFTMTYPSIPIIYYGTEIGMDGMEDPDNRRDMLWDHVEASAMLEFYKTLVGLRKTEALKSGEFKLLESDNNYLAYLRDSVDEFVLVLMNIKDKEMEIEIDLEGKEGILKSIFSETEYEIRDNKLKLSLEPLDLMILIGGITQ